jgi:hypothetical protein
MNIIRLISCDTAVEAHLIKGKLNNEGIECYITNENIATLKPGFNDLLGFGVEIMINEEDLAKARELLKDKFENEETISICPFCGSDRIGIGYRKNKIAMYFFIILAMLLARPLGNINTKYYCKQCKKEIR